MQCPHCTIHFADNSDKSHLYRHGHQLAWDYITCQCPECDNLTIYLEDPQGKSRLVFPMGANRGPVPPHVPTNVAEDYVEACNVLPISAKASAALSRRCLQNVLRSHGYRARDLATEIDLLLSETDASKAIPQTLRVTIDGVRNFGNFSAHPITDVTGLQIIDVEPHEAEWCLEILEEAFQHFYVRPAEAAARKAALDAKLAAAGKPPSK